MTYVTKYQGLVDKIDSKTNEESLRQMLRFEMEINLADIAGSSNTKSMVRQVIAYCLTHTRDDITDKPRFKEGNESNMLPELYDAIGEYQGNINLEKFNPYEITEDFDEVNRSLADYRSDLRSLDLESDLCRRITDGFQLDGIKNLAFYIGISPTHMAGRTTPQLAAQLLDYADHLERTNKLLAVIRTENPYSLRGYSAPYPKI